MKTFILNQNFYVTWSYERICSVMAFVFDPGVMLAVDAVIAELKKQSKPVTTPEEIAQVRFFIIFYGKVLKILVT